MHFFGKKLPLPKRNRNQWHRQARFPDTEAPCDNIPRRRKATLPDRLPFGACIPLYAFFVSPFSVRKEMMSARKSVQHAKTPQARRTSFRTSGVFVSGSSCFRSGRSHAPDSLYIRLPCGSCRSLPRSSLPALHPAWTKAGAAQAERLAGQSPVQLTVRSASRRLTFPVCPFPVPYRSAFCKYAGISKARSR